MADKATTIYTLKVFEMGLGIVPNFSTLNKAVKDLQVRIPKAIREATGVDSLPETLKAYAESNKFADALDAIGKWCKEAIGYAEKQDEDAFESKRGRDVTHTKYTLFGKTMLVPEHAGALIKGSKLEKIIAEGPGEGFTQWKELLSVLNSIDKAMQAVIPDAERPKRKAKGTAAAENAEGETATA
jgi:hypothetical protein